jgi:hypothetical protein
LLVAQNVGLFLFGLLAVLGELACLTTAVVVMPAVLQLARRSPDLPIPGFEWDRGTDAAAQSPSEPDESATSAPRTRAQP